MSFFFLVYLASDQRNGSTSDPTQKDTFFDELIYTYSYFFTIITYEE